MSESEGFQAPTRCLCVFMVSALLARYSGCCARLRPTRKFLRVACFAQFEQNFLSLLILTPQLPQTCSGFGWFTAGTSLPFTSRLFRCVRRVAISCRASLDAGLEIEGHSSCATYSATGATSLRHVSEVSQSLIANDDTMRQLPFLCSK